MYIFLIETFCADTHRNIFMKQSKSAIEISSGTLKE